MLDLSKKDGLRLISSKQDETVKSAMTEKLYNVFKNKGQITCDNYRDLRCSLVKTDNDLTFLYRYAENTPPVGHDIFLCVVAERNDSKFMLKTIESLLHLANPQKSDSSA
jgi:hypothetical protein